jgi:CRISPR-associated protein Csh1
VINAIAELGQYMRQENHMDFLDLMLDDAFDNGKNKHLFVVVFDENLRFQEVQYKEFDSTYKKNILYKRGSSSGTDYTPTSKITKIETTFDKKFFKWFEQNKDSRLLQDNERNVLNKIFFSLMSCRDEIIKEIEDQINLITDKSGKVLTLGFIKDTDDISLVGSKNIFKRILLDKAQEDLKYSKTHKVHSYSENKTCSICNKKKDEVFGFFTDLKFYNVDKDGMVTGGFQRSAAWKNYPVCLDCVLDVRNGYSMLQKHFDFRFYGLKYYFIPIISKKKDYQKILEIFLEFKKNPKFRTEDIKRLTNDEFELFELAKEKKLNISFDLFFYENPQKSVLRILLIIEDLLPSKLNVLFKNKKEIDNIIFFKQARSKVDEPLCYFNFGVVRNFFPNSSIEGNKDKYFLEITEKIFKGKFIDLQFIIQNIMEKIRSRFSRNQTTWLDTLKGFMLLTYLFKLNLIKKQKEVELNNQFFKEFKIQKNEEFESKVNLFFDSFKSFFATDAHKAIFLIGVLAQFLLNIQKNERDTSPFRSKLKGLKMSAYDISVLLPKIINKLEEYNKNYYKTIEGLASKYLLSSGSYNEWRLPIDEMNLIFVLGMNLSKYFKIISEKKEEE